MRVVIIGGGKVGGYLARELRKERHTVTVVEREPGRARSLGEQLDALVLLGDGTDVRILDEARVDRADWVLAVTGVDQDNLVSCQLARAAYGCRRVLARLNDPRNRPTFDALGVDVVGVTDLMVQIISRELDVQELVRVALLGRGQVSLLECTIPEGMPTRLVAELHLPPSTVLVTLVRAEEVEVPGPRTEIRPGDKVMAVTAVENEDDVLDALTTPGDFDVSDGDRS